MAVRIYLEIGHEASIRTKKTQDGFTHDWEVFVRGCEGAEIHYYVEKVVFYLHETFPKPKRVVKEPPYSVKESGYAGFNLPIDIYLRNGNEPKKIRFNYDLHLQQSGPAILKVQKEKYVFNAPSEEFKFKLLKGGGTIATSTNIQEVNDSRSTLDDKNQMMSKPKLAGSDLMKRPKLKASEPYNTNFQELFGSPIMTSSKPASDQKTWKDPKNTPKSDKGNEKARTKHSPHKDGHKEKDKSKDKVDSEKKSGKEDKKVKEKMKDRERSKDKAIKRERSPRPNSPSPKRSPKRSPSRLSSPPVSKHKEGKQHDKREKSEDKKSKKRNKEHKENKHSDEQKIDEHKDKARGESKKDVVKVKTETLSPPQLKVAEKKEKVKEKSKDSSKEDRSNSEKHSEKYKSKKKDKEKRDKKEEKYKAEKKLERPPPPLPPPVEIKPITFIKSEPPSPVKKEKASTYQSLIDDDSSNSSMSSSASSTAEKKPRIETKVKEEKNLKLKKEKGYQDNTIKCKRKSNSPEIDESPEKKPRENLLNNNSDRDQEVAGKTFVVETPHTEEDYISVLRDLQHKIMGLKDNSDLQKVVQLIAETGRYEVSAHTFDFDLCLLDRSTVQQLQNFFANES